MPVPSSYNDLKEGVDFREFCGWAFYQRTIAVPSFALGERVMLRFAAVTHHAKAFLNGHEICCHVGGKANMMAGLMGGMGVQPLRRQEGQQP